MCLQSSSVLRVFVCAYFIRYSVQAAYLRALANMLQTEQSTL